MKVSNYLFILINFLILIFATQIIPSAQQDSIDETTKKDIQDIKTLKKRTKLAACFSLLRLNLEKGNENLKSLLRNTKFDKSETYNFIIYDTLNNCMSIIKDDQIDKILDPDNIFSYNTELDRSLIIINDKILNNKRTLELSEELSFIVSELEEINKGEINENYAVEEEIGLFGFKLNQPGLLQYIFVVIGIALTSIVVLGGLFVIFRGKKDKNKKKKRRNKNDEDDDEKEE